MQSSPSQHHATLGVIPAGMGRGSCRMRLLLKLSVFNCTRMQIRQVFMNLGSRAHLRLC